MELKEYIDSERLIFNVSTETRENKTYIIIGSCSKKATHIMVFKWRSGLVSPKDLPVSEWGEPVNIFDRQELLHRMGGAAGVSGNAGEYVVAAAMRDEAGVHYCDRITAELINNHNVVWYSVSYTRNNDCDKVTVSFNPAKKESNAGFIPFNEIFYTVSHHPNLKYPISEKMMKNEMFEIIVPRDCRVSLICESSRIKISEELRKGK